MHEVVASEGGDSIRLIRAAQHVVARGSDDDRGCGDGRRDEHARPDEHCDCLALHAHSFPGTHAFTEM
jgi:hypothetical protein